MDWNKFNKLCLELDKKYNINSGACKFIASLVAKFCEEHNIEYKTKVYYYEDECIHPWHFSIVIDGIEINPSTYEYAEWEYEITRIEDCWNSKKLKKSYIDNFDKRNYFKKYRQKAVKDKIMKYLVS